MKNQLKYIEYVAEYAKDNKLVEKLDEKKLENNRFDCKLIAIGRTADIYDLGNGKVFKHFHEDKPDRCIDNEIECTSSIAAIRLGAPKIYGRVNDKRGRGIIMEYVVGQSMLDIMIQEGDGFHIEKNAEILANLQCKVSSFEGGMFPKGHEVMRERISRVSALDEDTKCKLIKLLESLPQGNSVCHTDIHPGNIIITEEGFRVIDWCDTMCDSPWLDVASTLLIFESVAEIPGLDSGDLNRSRCAWKKHYRAVYENLVGKSDEELEGWMAILAAVKLEKEDPINHPWMLELIRRGVCKV